MLSRCTPPGEPPVPPRTSAKRARRGTHALVSHAITDTVKERCVKRGAGLVTAPEETTARAKLSGLPACREPAGGWGHDHARGFRLRARANRRHQDPRLRREPTATLLVNQPLRTRGVVRVTSPFTVESESPWSHVPFDDVGNGSSGEGVASIPVEHAEFAGTVVEALKRSPIHAAPDAGRAGALHVNEIEP